MKKADLIEKVSDSEASEMWRHFGDAQGHVFKDYNEAIMAYQNKQVHLHTRIAILASSLKKTCFSEKQNNEYLITTIGKLIFNNIFERFPVHQRSYGGITQKYTRFRIRTVWY